MYLTFVCEHYFPEIGGLERSTHRLARCLIDKGHKVHVIAPRLPETKDLEYLDNVPITRSKQDDTLPFTASERSYKLLKQADAICVFGIGDDPEVKIWQPVFEIKNTPNFLKIGTVGDTLVKGISQDIIQRFTGIFCQNEAIVEEVRSLGFPEERCYRICNGLDIEGWINSLPDQKTVSTYFDIDINASFVISAIGRFVRRKRFPDIIRAFQKFSRSDIKSYLLLHGSDFGQSDGEEKYIRELVSELNLPDSAQIKIVSPKISPSFTLTVSDVSVSLGTREGAPNIILESLASGVPVICSDISGHRVYIDEDEQGWFCNSTSDYLVDDLASLFKRVSLNQYLKFMTEKCQKKANQFNIRKTSQLYIEAILKNLGQ